MGEAESKMSTNELPNTSESASPSLEIPVSSSLEKSQQEPSTEIAPNNREEKPVDPLSLPLPSSSNESLVEETAILINDKIAVEPTVSATHDIEKESTTEFGPEELSTSSVDSQDDGTSLEATMVPIYAPSQSASPMKALYGSILTLVNTSIGSGLIAAPFAFACLGVFPGLFWISLSAFFVGFSLNCLFKVAIHLERHANNQGDYSVKTSLTKAAKLISPSFEPIIAGVIIIQGFGVCISYLVLVGNSLPFLVSALFGIEEDTISRPLCILLSLIFVIFPMCLFRTLKSLRFASIIALSCIAYIVFVIFLYFIFYLIYAGSFSFILNERVVDYFKIASLRDLFRALPIFVFGFTCHHNACKLFNELPSEARNARPMTFLSLMSFTLILAIYSVVGILGYLTLGNGVSADILSVYDLPGTVFHEILDRVDPYRLTLFLARLAIVLLVMTCYPMQLHPTRDEIFMVYQKAKHFIRKRSRRLSSRTYSPIAQDDDDLLIEGDVQRSLLPTSNPVHTSENMSLSALLIITMLFCTLSFTVASFVTDFSRVLAFVGATGANMISLFFGPYLYFWIAPNHSISKYGTVITMILSFVLMIGVLYFELAK